MSSIQNNQANTIKQPSRLTTRLLFILLTFSCLALFYPAFLLAQDTEQEPEPVPSEEVQQTALRIGAEYIRVGFDEVSLQFYKGDRIPSTGAPIFQFGVVRYGNLNGVPYVFALDEAGQQLDLTELEAREGVRFFEVSDITVAPIPNWTPVSGAAITIDPRVNNLVLNQGDTFNEVITVTIPGAVTIPKVDVYFLADTTGSMGQELAAVKSASQDIMSTLVISYPTTNWAFGVGNYADFNNYDPYAFKHQQSLISNIATVSNTINSLPLLSGVDTPEGQLYALDQLAEPPNGTIGWRTGTERIIVWFGDAPGHDPVCQAISGLSYDITEASVTAKLTVQQITVLAINTSSWQGLDDDPTANAGDYINDCITVGGTSGQASRITSSTGGQLVSSGSPSTIANTIINLVSNAVNTYNNVNLVPTGSSAPFVASIAPAGGYGPLPANVDHVLTFDVDFLGIEPCTDVAQTFRGTIDVVIDGVVVAAKQVTITVPPCPNGISGVKFHDENGNRQNDGTEPLLAGWQIVLVDQAGNVAITTTDATGSYSFSDLPPGTYTVYEIAQPGWTQTAPATGSHTVTIQPGERITGLDFGNRPCEQGDPDIQVTKSSELSFFTAGQTASYQLLVENIGSGHAVGPITLTDLLPFGLTATGNGWPAGGWNCTVSGQLVTCVHPGPLPPGYRFVIPLEVIVGDETDYYIENCAEVDLHGDIDYTNNRSCVGHDVARNPEKPDLSIEKSTDLPLFTVGQTATYKLLVRNLGPGAATGSTTVNDTLPAGLTPTRASWTTIDGWNCVVSGSLVACTSPSALPAGYSTVIPIEVTVGPDAVPGIENCADVAHPMDINNRNNLSCVGNQVRWDEPKGTGDLGDAPDSTNRFGAEMMTYFGSVPANFPTIFAGGPIPGPIHWQPKGVAWLGQGVSDEADADQMPDADGLVNIVPPSMLANRDGYDDGIQFDTLALPECAETKFAYDVTAVSGAEMFVNVWFDFNRDGDWDDVLECRTAKGMLTVHEWAVQDQIIGFGPGTTSHATLPFVSVNVPTADSPMWMRMTLSERKAEQATITQPTGATYTYADGRGPTTGFEVGETEDCLLPFNPDNPVCSDKPRGGGDDPSDAVDSDKALPDEAETETTTATVEEDGTDTTESTSQTFIPFITNE